jgi:hypothetical protein
MTLCHLFYNSIAASVKHPCKPSARKPAACPRLPVDWIFGFRVKPGMTPVWVKPGMTLVWVKPGMTPVWVKPGIQKSNQKGASQRRAATAHPAPIKGSAAHQACYCIHYYIDCICCCNFFIRKCCSGDEICNNLCTQCALGVKGCVFRFTGRRCCGRFPRRRGPG